MSEDGAGLDRRHFLLGAVGVGAGAMLTACTGNKKKAAAATSRCAPRRPARRRSNDAPGTAVTIGFSSPAADHGWTGAIAKNAASEAAKYSDVKLQTVQATNDVAAQIAGIQTLITKKVDVIVMLPYDGKQLTQVALSRHSKPASRWSTSTACSTRRGHRASGSAATTTAWASARGSTSGRR